MIASEVGAQAWALGSRCWGPAWCSSGTSAGLSHVMGAQRNPFCSTVSGLELSLFKETCTVSLARAGSFTLILPHGSDTSLLTSVPPGPDDSPRWRPGHFPAPPKAVRHWGPLPFCPQACNRTTVSKPRTQIQKVLIPRLPKNVTAPFVWGGGCTQPSASGACQHPGKVRVGAGAALPGSLRPTRPPSCPGNLGCLGNLGWPRGGPAVKRGLW